jgi:hypothetical protein
MRQTRIKIAPQSEKSNVVAVIRWVTLQLYVGSTQRILHIDPLGFKTSQGRLRIVLPQKFPMSQYLPTNSSCNVVESMSSLEYGLPCIDHNDIGVEEVMVDAGIGGGYANTNQLHTHKYEGAMASVERPLCEEEFNNMEEHRVFKPIDRSLGSPTWVLKTKATGKNSTSSVLVQDRFRRAE